MNQTPRMFNALRQIAVSKRLVRISPPLEANLYTQVCILLNDNKLKKTLHSIKRNKKFEKCNKLFITNLRISEL